MSTGCARRRAFQWELTLLARLAALLLFRVRANLTGGEHIPWGKRKAWTRG